MTSILDWTHDISDVAGLTRQRERVANADELRWLAEALDLVGCERLSVSYAISDLGGGRFRLQGSLQAQVVQACVVTLEPVSSHVEESFDVEFRPVNLLPGVQEGELPVLTDDYPEPIEGGRIEVGRVVYEHLSGALDPYPRKQGVKFEWRESEANRSKTSGPFDALARLKK